LEQPFWALRGPFPQALVQEPPQEQRPPLEMAYEEAMTYEPDAPDYDCELLRPHLQPH
jgi:hypothetical protein